VAYAYLVLILAWVVAFVFSIAHRMTRKWFLAPRGEGTSDQQSNWLHLVFLDLLFYSLLPGLLLVFFYPVLPFSGFHSGLALGVVGFLLGAGPVYLFSVIRGEQPVARALHDAFFHLCKMLVCFGLIGILYAP